MRRRGREAKVKSRFVVEERKLKPLSVKPTELMTLTEAARVLGVSVSSMGDLTDRGVLSKVIDREENNPRKAHRVLRFEVVEELARRRRLRAAGNRSLAQ